jgi:hypothetical protein
MAKKTSDGVMRIAPATEGEGICEEEGMPPLLSEKFIARLQAAVEAAQRRTMPPPRFERVREDESCANP